MPQPRDAEAFAESVVLAIKSALSPILERLAAAEARLGAVAEAYSAAVPVIDKSLADLRERFVALETKACAPIDTPVDLSPVLERLAAAEARLGVLPLTEKSLSDVRDRLVIVETKAAAPVETPTVDLSPVLERLAVAESRIAQLPDAEKAIGEMRDRLLVFETKAAIPPAVTLPEPVDLAPVLERVAELREAITVAKSAPVVDLSPLTDRISKLESKSVESSPVVADLTKDVAGLRERLAVVETRQPVPGPAGPAGHDGKDGRDGKDGADGIGFDDLSVDFDGDRTLALKFERGTRTKTFPIRLPFMRQEGIYVEGKNYDVGDVVTWGGSQWHCQSATTTKPGEGSKDWLLIVKRGRDGKDGRDAVTTPVVSVGAR